MNSITIGGVTRSLSGSQQPIHLYMFHNLAGAAQSLKRISATNADYVVPSGRRFVMLGFKLQHTNAGGNYWFYVGDTADAVTVLRVKIGVPTFAGLSEYYDNDDPPTNTYCAGKYVTGDPSTTQISWAYAVGYEENV